MTCCNYTKLSKSSCYKTVLACCRWYSTVMYTDRLWQHCIPSCVFQDSLMITRRAFKITLCNKLWYFYTIGRIILQSNVTAGNSRILLVQAPYESAYCSSIRRSVFPSVIWHKYKSDIIEQLFIKNVHGYIVKKPYYLPTVTFRYRHQYIKLIHCICDINTAFYVMNAVNGSIDK